MREPAGSGADPAAADTMTRRAVAMAALLYALLAAGGCLWIALRAGPDGFRRLVGDGFAGAAVGCGLAAALVGLSAAASRAFAWFRAMEEEIRRAIGPLSGGQAAVLAVASGAGEELFFRGAMQAAWGWVAAGLVFGGLHVPVRRTLLPWTLMAVAVGLLFGWCASWRGGILGVTAAHVIVNAANLWRLCGAPKR